MTSKFKVGDKLAFIHPYGSYGVGDVVKVEGYDVHTSTPMVYFKGVNGKGSAYESRFELVEPKPSKNQRITALEETVAKQGEEISELKLIVAQIRKPSTVVEEALTAATTVEDTIEFEGDQYKKVDRVAREGDVVIFNDVADSRAFRIKKPYKVLEGLSVNGGSGYGHFSVYTNVYNRTPKTVDVYELIVEDKPQSDGERLVKQCEQHFSPVEKSPNEKRAEMIEKAKSFVGENGGDDYLFDIDENKGTVFAYKVITPGVGRYGVKYGFSKCHPNDVFNADVGKAISFGRAEKLDVSEFEQAVQPKILVSGHVIEYTSDDAGIYKGKSFTVSSLSDGNIYYTNGDEYNLFSGRDFGIKIINDTNAIYGGGE